MVSEISVLFQDSFLRKRDVANGSFLEEKAKALEFVEIGVWLKSPEIVILIEQIEEFTERENFFSPLFPIIWIEMSWDTFQENRRRFARCRIDERRRYNPLFPFLASGMMKSNDVDLEEVRKKIN